MEVINKKLVIVVILIGILSSIFIWQNISDKETKLEMVSLNNETKQTNMFAIMLEEIDEEGNSTYVESSDNMWPSLKYKYNTTNSGCLDVNGTSIPDILSYDSRNQKAIVRTRSVAYCYLYFDIDESVYAKVRNDYTDNKGALLLSETESDEYPVYYYSGNITNNNILYANFCWKMVRTTETGGVKLIYNGVPDTAEDGTKTCDNTGDESQIGTSAAGFNSLAYAGYMYNTVYPYMSKDEIKTLVVTIAWNPSEYYYGDTATWDGSKYVLSNSDGSEVGLYAWSNNYNNLKNYYACKTETSCESVLYVLGGTSTYMHYYELNNNLTKNDYKIKIATSVTNNEDGTYTLVNPIEVIKADWYTNYSSYKNYYYCKDLTSETCSDMYYSGVSSNVYLIGYSLLENFKYGNSFIYEDGVYTLVDTKEFWNWYENYNNLNNHHYTCFNENGKCETIKYIYYTNYNGAKYIDISNGKRVEDAINEMLYAEDVNEVNSSFKNKIDTWYENNIVDVLDINNILYSVYLENTIWCNNRATTNLSSSGWNPNGGDTTTTIKFDYNAYKCENKTDQFTLKVEAGGTEGYGNNTLDYPVGLITAFEIELATSKTYLCSAMNQWSFSPAGSTDTAIQYRYINSNCAYAQQHIGYYNFGLRPVVSLSNKIEITTGDGSASLPYQVILVTN